MAKSTVHSQRSHLLGAEGRHEVRDRLLGRGVREPVQDRHRRRPRGRGRDAQRRDPERRHDEPASRDGGRGAGSPRAGGHHPVRGGDAAAAQAVGRPPRGLRRGLPAGRSRPDGGPGVRRRRGTAADRAARLGQPALHRVPRSRRDAGHQNPRRVALQGLPGHVLHQRGGGGRRAGFQGDVAARDRAQGKGRRRLQPRRDLEAVHGRGPKSGHRAEPRTRPRFWRSGCWRSSGKSISHDNAATSRRRATISLQRRGRREKVAPMHGRDGFSDDAAASPIGEDAARLAAERMAFAANALPALIAYVDATGRYRLGQPRLRTVVRATDRGDRRTARERDPRRRGMGDPRAVRGASARGRGDHLRALRGPQGRRLAPPPDVIRPPHRRQGAGPRLRRAGDRHHRDEDGDGAAAERADARAVAGDRAPGQLAADPRRKAGSKSRAPCSGRTRPTASSASTPTLPSATGRTSSGTCTPTTAGRWRPGPPTPPSTSNRSSRSIESCAPTGACGSSTRAFSSSVRPTAGPCARSAPVRTSPSASRPSWRSAGRASNSSSSSTRRRPSSPVTTADQRLVWANKSYAARFGKTPEELVGRRLVDLVGEAAWRLIEPFCLRVLAGETIATELNMPYPGGSRFVHLSASPTHDPGRCSRRLCHGADRRQPLAPAGAGAGAGAHRAARGRSPQGRIPGHAVARAAQPAGAHPEFGRGPRAPRPASRGARGHVHEDHRSAGAAHEAPARRPPRRFAREPGQDRAAERARGSGPTPPRGGRGQPPDARRKAAGSSR